MGQHSEPTGIDMVFVVGIDALGNPRGARFAILKDAVVSAAMDMNCVILIRQSHEVSSLGLQLPIGSVLESGGKAVKLIVPNIHHSLYREILAAKRSNDQRRALRRYENLH